MKVESEDRIIKNSARTIYTYISDFNNFSHLMPDQIENWQCTETSCSFSIKGFFSLGLEIAERDPYKTIIIREGAGIKSPFPFEMQWLFTEKSDNETLVKMSLDADVNPMIGMMAKKPLQNLANICIEKLDQMLG